MPKQRWPRPMEKPDNAIWAKDNKEPDLNDSFDLPLQGTRKSGYNDNGNGNGNGDEKEADPELDVFGTYRYHRGGV